MILKGNTIKLQGEELFYTEKNINAKKTIVFIHGFNSSHAFMNSLLTTNHEYNIVAIDMPGNGNSTVNSAPTIKKYQKIIEEFINVINYKDIIVLGHSLGGASAAYAAVKCPKVKKLILLSAINPYMISSDKIRDGLMLLLQPRSLEDAIIGISTLISNHKKRSKSKTIMPLSRSLFNIVKQSRTVFKKMITDEILNKDFLETELLELYKSVKVPIWLIHGDNDHFIDVKFAEKLANDLDSEITVIDKCGHAPIFEYPSLLNSLFNKFIK